MKSKGGASHLNHWERRPTMRLSRHMFDDVHKDAVPESPSTDYEISRPPFEEKDFELEDEENKEEKKQDEQDNDRERRTEMISFEDSSL
jgi:hypothetical protein